MPKGLLLSLSLLLTFNPVVSATDYRCRSVTLKSAIEEPYIQLVADNAGAFYSGLASRYFRLSVTSPLTIYYAHDQAEARRLLIEDGHKTESDQGYCVPSSAIIYAYPADSDGQKDYYSVLYPQIVSYLVKKTDPTAPAWFTVGLSRFFANQGRIVNGRLLIACPAAGQQLTLKKDIADGAKFSIALLVSSTDEQFSNREVGPDFAHAFFYWLYDSGLLEKYITGCRNRHDMAALEEAASMSQSKISVELLKFIRSNFQTSDLIEKALASDDPNEKKTSLAAALELRPDHQIAKLELAKCLSKENEIQKSRELLAEIMGADESVEYRQAAQWMAVSFESEKDFTHAAEYYAKAWDASQEYEYRYRLAYQVASCYYRLNNHAKAKEWYQKFLDDKWDVDAWTEQAAFARRFLAIDQQATPNYADSNNIDSN